jgi:proline dehydrogenase
MVGSMLKATLLKAAGSGFLQRQVTSNPIARRVADRFIAGNTLDEAEHAIRTLNAGGMSVALDYLGENTESEAQARESTGAYLAAIDRIQDRGMDANISVKLTAMGLDIREDLALEEASRVAARGKEVGAMVGVDMEAAVYVGRTLDIVEALKRDYDNVGVCVQSYLYRSRDDLDRLNRLGVPVRLVKGAYQESPEVAYPEKASVDHAYARMLDSLLAVNPYPMVATHDPAMVRFTKTLVARHRRDRDSFEFQMLYGVRRDLQAQVVAEGYRLRVYLPYGTQWYPYFMRRLAERPANLYFFLSNLVKR